MNTYYSPSMNNTYSEPRTYGRRRAARRVRGYSLRALIERLLCLLDALCDAIASARVLTVVRTVVTAACFFGIIGIIGGVEHETISWGGGVLIALVIAVIEAVCLYKCRRN